MAQTFSISEHPYYPQYAEIPDYVPNTSSVIELMMRFGCFLTITIVTALWIATRFNANLRLFDKLVFGWFVLCGTLHCFFEGYFVYNQAGLAGSQDLFSQLWKEYALSDSRYLTEDPFMLCVEAITVMIWGPLCFTTAVSIARNGSLRHPLQIIVSVAHLYGVALYYSTCYINERYRGLVYSRPEPLYYWVYYFGFNAPWVVVPAVLLKNSVRFIQRGTIAIDRAAATLDKRKDRFTAAVR
ncbi:3-beta-hydroxysteroid-Delta(8),Delta(7)-isomerase [Cytospora mali]|uniref:3-beta-hydroxysteroid-Delta(8), Delta(7)-isomerase n=1 Tax=Cytospora mali TaxID=578113 RepID=A0A194VA61_CYTMA|nr:3-beta-hydroxysteroid-Delta(8),Delta(7)-isomerase [Valsa mali var. pyri (nom. inval.)]